MGVDKFAVISRLLRDISKKALKKNTSISKSVTEVAG